MLWQCSRPRMLSMFFLRAVDAAAHCTAIKNFLKAVIENSIIIIFFFQKQSVSHQWICQIFRVKALLDVLEPFMAVAVKRTQLHSVWVQTAHRLGMEMVFNVSLT